MRVACPHPAALALPVAAVSAAGGQVGLPSSQKARALPTLRERTPQRGPCRGPGGRPRLELVSEQANDLHAESLPAKVGSACRQHRPLALRDLALPDVEDGVGRGPLQKSSASWINLAHYRDGRRTGTGGAIGGRPLQRDPWPADFPIHTRLRARCGHHRPRRDRHGLGNGRSRRFRGWLIFLSRWSC